MLQTADVVSAALHTLYSDFCDVYAEVEYERDNGSTGSRRDLIASDVKCRLSFSSHPAAGNGDVAPLQQSVRLFVDRDVVIPEGSVIEVRRHGDPGKVERYRRSGSPAVYGSHTEYDLELEKRWA